MQSAEMSADTTSVDPMQQTSELANTGQALAAEESYYIEELQRAAQQRDAELQQLDALDKELQAFAQTHGALPKLTELRRQLRGASQATSVHSTAQQKTRDAWQQALDARRQALEATKEAIAAERAFQEQAARRRQQLQTTFAELQQSDPQPAPAQSDAQPQQAERRQHERASLNAQIGFSTENNFFTGFTQDISEGGIFIATVAELPIGSPVSLTLTLPDGSPVEAEGEVRWRREYNELNPDIEPGLGVQFRQLSLDALENIQGFVAQREPLFFEPDCA